MTEESPPPPLPEVLRGVLDAEGLGQYVRDLVDHAEVRSCIVRSGQRDTAGGAVDLAGIAELLLDGRTRAVQVRYRHDGSEWTDTLMAADGTVRVVRMRTPDRGAAPNHTADEPPS